MHPSRRPPPPSSSRRQSGNYTELYCAASSTTADVTVTTYARQPMRWASNSTTRCTD
ncbi:hypothetical protein PJI17_15190 [Mycobacterium kansasii]